MKKSFLLIVGILWACSLRGQILSSEVIASVGDYYSNGSLTLSFSEGVIIEDVVLNNQTSFIEYPVTTDVFFIYPNPAADYVVIDITDMNAEKCCYRIFNATGVLISSGNIAQNWHQVNTSDLSNGLYFFEVTSGFQVQTQKLIIQKY